jgi:hypothetical protein
MSEFFGPVAYLHPYILQILFAEALFAVFLKRRSKFILRLCIVIPCYIFIAAIIPALIYPFAQGFLSMSIFVLSLAIFPLCFHINFTDTLFCGISAMAVQNLTYNCTVLNCLMLNTGSDITLNVILIQGITYVAVYSVCFFFFARKLKNIESISVGRLSMLAVSTFLMIIAYILQWIFSNQESNFAIDVICSILFSCINVLSLFLLFGMMKRSKLLEENRILEQLIASNAKQYEMSEENIEIINMKCHDLKHQISVLKTEENEKSFAEIEKAIMVYDNIAKTGNKVLDVILSKESLICEKYKIKFTYIVDAKGLEKIDPIDIASIFYNSLDNSIEYLSQVEEVGKRVMSLKVMFKNNLLSIHLMNYLDSNLKFDDGMPLTTKSDTNFHGFGLKSIRYIAQKYGGNMVISVKNKFFILDVMIPINK